MQTLNKNMRKYSDFFIVGGLISFFLMLVSPDDDLILKFGFSSLILLFIGFAERPEINNRGEETL